ncbi:hypothetical protein HXP44_31515 [Streptomyces sioyaensis]|uniref:Uncharacterized protein n=1 Tax=Streptomyces sioyaensis TaxID=67364 RepID=A0A4Q1QU25_9ACTN|nr:hypothetical protein [Streptomyces sioyaensis]MBM4796440.1 hypothetical protein [Streptomyces sioyaensis]RXS66642.1 hypothetical protein EST54_14730 [Streptomyces sioyaensis]
MDMPLADHDENVWRRSEAHAAFSLRGDRLAVLTRGAAATIAGSAVSALLLMTTPDRYGMHGMSLQMALVMGPLALSLSAYGRLAVARIWLGATGRLP